MRRLEADDDIVTVQGQGVTGVEWTVSVFRPTGEVLVVNSLGATIVGCYGRATGCKMKVTGSVVGLDRCVLKGINRCEF